jgi:hypothetical protein
MDTISLIGIGSALLFTGIGAFFAYKCLIYWEHTNISSICAEMSKNRSFLSNNFKLVILAGAFSGLRVLLELIEKFNLIPTITVIQDIFHALYYLDISATMLILSILAIIWYRLLSKINAWDKRVIKIK